MKVAERSAKKSTASLRQNNAIITGKDYSKHLNNRFTDLIGKNKRSRELWQENNSAVLSFVLDRLKC